MKNEKIVTVEITNSDLFNAMTKNLVKANVEFHQKNATRDETYDLKLRDLLVDWKSRAGIVGDDAVVFMGTLEYLGYNPSVRNHDRMVVNIPEHDSLFQYTYKIQISKFPRTLTWSEIKNPKELSRYLDNVTLKLQNVRELH